MYFKTDPENEQLPQPSHGNRSTYNPQVFRIEQ